MSTQESEVEHSLTNGASPPAKPAKKAPEVRIVQMEDGSTEEFVGRKKMNKYYDLDEHGNLLGARFCLANGKVFKTTPPASLLGRFAGHGLIQKYGDELAGLSKPGEEPDLDDWYLALEELDENIQKGSWSTRREGDGMSGTSILIQALVAYGGKPVEVVKAFLKTKDAKFKTALRLDEEHRNKEGKTMAQIVKEIEAAKASKGTKVDVASAFDELDALGA